MCLYSKLIGISITYHYNNVTLLLLFKHKARWKKKKNDGGWKRTLDIKNFYDIIIRWSSHIFVDDRISFVDYRWFICSSLTFITNLTLCMGVWGVINATAAGGGMGRRKAAETPGIPGSLAAVVVVDMYNQHWDS